ncbi:MAG: hypothetical protein EPN94_11030 [Nitrospirae bacterium]|nr:MAG: hypothetical protein EPN94_11030 [Nitrospirota bacterium]
MAVVNTKATAITNADAKPPVKSSKDIMNGMLKECVGTAEVANGDSIGSTYRLCRVRSSERISQVLLSCDAITTCAGDVGIYQTNDNGGAVVDADFFASALSLAAALVNSDVTHEADAADAGAGFGLADVEKPLWQALGLAADPVRDYDIVVTLTAAAASAGTIAGKVKYV